MNQLPELQSVDGSCNTCHKDIILRIPIHVNIRVLPIWIKYLQCPECGAGEKKLVMGRKSC